MSHSHTHAPGQPSHSHGPPAPQQQMPQGGPQQAPKMPQPDTVMQALIEASFQPVELALGPPDNVSAVCSAHSLEKCADCDLDFASLNRYARLLHMNPTLRCPPPAQMVTQRLSQVVNNTKEEGNTLYKTGQHAMAIQRYTMAANIAAQRPPWEQNGLMREELSTNLSNRAAAYFEAGDYLSSLVDAEMVIQLRKPWSKGYFRKARALVKLQQFQDAKETVEAGLVFEPDNAEMNTLLVSIEAQLRERLTLKSSEKTNGVETASST